MWIIRHQRNWSSNYRSFRLKKIYFFWICRDTQSFEWFRSLLSTIEADTSSDFLEINIHLTRSLDPQKLTNVFLLAGERSDPITELQSRTKFGRPNFEDFFRRMQEENRIRLGKSDIKDVGVFLCGPVEYHQLSHGICFDHCRHHDKNNMCITIIILQYLIALVYLGGTKNCSSQSVSQNRIQRFCVPLSRRKVLDVLIF